MLPSFSLIGFQQYAPVQALFFACYVEAGHVFKGIPVVTPMFLVWNDMP